MEGSRGHLQRKAAVRQRSHKHNTNGVQPTTKFSNQLQFSMDTHETVNQQLASFATKKNMYRGTHLSENEVDSPDRPIVWIKGFKPVVQTIVLNFFSMSTGLFFY